MQTEDRQEAVRNAVRESQACRPKIGGNPEVIECISNAIVAHIQTNPRQNLKKNRTYWFCSLYPCWLIVLCLTTLPPAREKERERGRDRQVKNSKQTPLSEPNRSLPLIRRPTWKATQHYRDDQPFPFID